MIDSCPSSWKIATTAHACMCTNYTADPLMALPVLDVTRNVNYANIYCAICNGKSRDLHHWSFRIWWRRVQRKSTLQDVKSADTTWEAVPLQYKPAEKCIVTPPVAKKEPDSRIKRLCRSYANVIGFGDGDKRIFKNPHCALLAHPNVLANKSVRCGQNPFPSRWFSTLFVFSSYGKSSSRHAVRVKFNCSVNTFYDPFQNKCVSLHSSQFVGKIGIVSPTTSMNHSNTTIHRDATAGQCRGPSFLPHEFRISRNKSVFIIPHKKLYGNDSYAVTNGTLTLCLNVSRNHNINNNPQKVTPTGIVKLSDHSLTLRIITYVGFSLSIIALLVLLITYFLFAELRTYPGKMVMQLSCAMIAMQLVYFLSDPDVVSSAVCSVMGALLHYFILAVFIWMSCIAQDTKKTLSNPSKWISCICFPQSQPAGCS